MRIIIKSQKVAPYIFAIQTRIPTSYRLIHSTIRGITVPVLIQCLNNCVCAKVKCAENVSTSCNDTEYILVRFERRGNRARAVIRLSTYRLIGYFKKRIKHVFYRPALHSFAMTLVPN